MKSTAKKQKTSSPPKPSLPSQSTAEPSQSTSGLAELFADGIKDMYWAENHLVKSLPKMVDAAGSAELKAAFKNHREITKQHAARLESVFEILGIKVQAKKCDACEGLVMSGEHIIENTEPLSPARDTGLIMAGLKVENYEITAYNGLIQLAGVLGQSEIAELLQQNLAEEIEADALLAELSNKGETELVVTNNSKASATGGKASRRKN